MRGAATRIDELFEGRWTLRDLVDFHAREKMLLLAHDRTTYERLGRLVAKAKGRAPHDVARDYRERFLAGLRRPTSRGKHVDVLMHLAGYFKAHEEKHGVHEAIDGYARGEVTLGVPVARLAAAAERRGVDYVAKQSYLEAFRGGPQTKGEKR